LQRAKCLSRDTESFKTCKSSVAVSTQGVGLCNSISNAATQVFIPRKFQAADDICRIERELHHLFRCGWVAQHLPTGTQCGARMVENGA